MEKISNEKFIPFYLRKVPPKIESKNTPVNFISLLPPPNPLIQRKNIPLNSPKFGKNISYIKLATFIPEQYEQEGIYVNSYNYYMADEKFEKSCELTNYINSDPILENDLTKEHKINIENIVNLNKKNSEIPKKKTILKPYFILNDNKDSTLIFESRFESGNLLASFKFSESYYQILTQNDTNTGGYSQWFYFRVSNTRKGTNIKFNLLNLTKKYSLYKKGMKILVYSEKKAEKEKIGWHRGGENIQYYSNSLYKFVKNSKRSLYSLTFNYEFEYDNDVVYFANTHPYTYTDLMKDLTEFQKYESKYDFFYKKPLCITLAGNTLDYFTITSNDKDDDSSKQGVVIMARVHPGETVSSWMMKGVIEFLTGDSDEAKLLRRKYIFKIIPMMNPDGVICGNYRTSLAGCDLNRRWVNPNEVLHPEIFYAKQMILKMSSQRKIALVCDLHGHSGAHNIFMYGNNIKEDPPVCKIFPFLLSKINSTFNFHQCVFKITKDKIGTARINLFNELNNIANIFTMEASFSGTNKGQRENLHFNTNVLVQMGKDLGLTIINFHNTYEANKTSRYNILNELNAELELMEKIKKENKEKMLYNLENNLLNLKDQESENESNGSDSEPSIDNIDKEMLAKLLPSQAKKKKKKVKKTKPLKSTIKNKKEIVIVKDKDSVTIINNAKKISTTQNVKNSIILTNNTHVTANKTFLGKIENKLKSSPDTPLKQIISKVNYSASKEPIKNTSLNINITVINNTTIQAIKKKDAETQTEEIFFKSHWTYFQAKNYTILSSKNINSKLTLASQFQSEKKYQLNLLNNSRTKSYSSEKNGVLISSNLNNNPTKGTLQVQNHINVDSSTTVKINTQNAQGNKNSNVLNKINSLNSFNSVYKSIKNFSSNGKQD